MISTDTTRADHLSCYGYERPTCPALDRLASESVFFRRAVSTSSWTLPAHATMFTGKFVTCHGARYDSEGVQNLGEAFGGDHRMAQYRVRSVTENETLLAETLHGNGYSTGAVVAGPWLKKNFGLHRGFDYHDDDNILGLDSNQKRLATEVTDRAVTWLNGSAQRPFFLFLNYFDPHTPYVIPQPLQNVFREPGKELSQDEEKIRQYDAEILFMDIAISYLLDQMRANGQYDNTMIIVVGDHGELLSEHGLFGHGRYLYEPLLHVPFFVKYPKGEQAAREIDHRVQPTEIVPMIMERLGIPVGDVVQGGPFENPGHPILSEVYANPSTLELGAFQALYEDDAKLLLSSVGNHQLYNLAADPGELTNRYTEQPDLAGAMTKRLLDLLQSLPRPEGQPVSLEFDSETQAQLKALGYL